MGEIAGDFAGVIFGDGRMIGGHATKFCADFLLVVNPVRAERKGVADEGDEEEVGIDVTHIIALILHRLIWYPPSGGKAVIEK